MTESDATILIPDISGFTEFMSMTELTHSSRAVSILIDAIVNAVEEEYDVVELEGDAVFMIKKGSSPSRKELQDVCLKIFNAFHFRRKWLQQHAICPCKACQELTNLTVKFVAHHGRISETKVGHFNTVSGTDVIVAHRLLKNSVPSHEYLLFTEKLLERATDSQEEMEMESANSSEEYSSLGKVPYRFALLNEVRKNIPDPPLPPAEYYMDETPRYEIGIAANFHDVYMMIMNIPGRAEWVPGLKKVEQDMPDVFVGSIHHCTFENFEAVISPLRMAASVEEIVYAESCSIPELKLSLVYEYVFKNINEKESAFACRLMNAGETPFPEESSDLLSESLRQMAESLKTYCEKQ